MPETQGSATISTRRQRIAERAQRRPGEALTPIAHHMDFDWLMEAYRRTRKDGAVGVDQQTAAAYAQDLEANLVNLLEQAKSGAYRAPPVRRTAIPKGAGGQRPLGIPTFEDKVLQRAVVMALEPVYESDFCDGSYGFRPGRSAHQALEALWQHVMRIQGGWVIDLDIRRFFDQVDHGLLQGVLRRRVRDGVLLRLIGKWLNAGVLEGEVVQRLQQGTPQGGVASPLLANIFLHEVLDTWFETEVRPRLRGTGRLFRFADDAVLVFRYKEDAERVMRVLPKRLARYGLELHPEKTQLVPFRRPSQWGRSRDRPGTFDFLGLTHHWARTRKGGWAVKQRTGKDRLRRTIRAIDRWCRAHRHAPVGYQQRQLAAKLRGHYAYFGVPGNYRALAAVYQRAIRSWRKWLSRRSQRGWIPWAAFLRFLRRHSLPRPRLRSPSTAA